MPKPNTVNHPQHYGGDTTYEVIKVLEAWGLDKSFCLGNTVKYIARAGKKGAALEDLEKAAWYLQREISNAKRAREAQSRLARRHGATARVPRKR